MSSANARALCDTSHRPDWPALLEQAAAIVHTYDTLVTLRQLFYRLVAAQLLPNNINAYKALSRYTAEARRARTFPRLMDRGRTIHRYQTFASRAEAGRWLQAIYRRDRTEGQKVSLYLGVEKAGIVEQLQEWFGDLGIPVVALGGYGSQTYVGKSLVITITRTLASSRSRVRRLEVFLQVAQDFGPFALVLPLIDYTTVAKGLDLGQAFLDRFSLGRRRLSPTHGNSSRSARRVDVVHECYFIKQSDALVVTREVCVRTTKLERPLPEGGIGWPRTKLLEAVAVCLPSCFERRLGCFERRIGRLQRRLLLLKGRYKTCDQKTEEQEGYDDTSQCFHGPVPPTKKTIHPGAARLSDRSRSGNEGGWICNESCLKFAGSAGRVKVFDGRQVRVPLRYPAREVAKLIRGYDPRGTLFAGHPNHGGGCFF
jgi:hypothetical protein